MHAFPSAPTPMATYSSAPDGAGATLNPSQPFRDGTPESNPYSSRDLVLCPRHPSPKTTHRSSRSLNSTVLAARSSNSMPGHCSRVGGTLATPLGVGEDVHHPAPPNPAPTPTLADSDLITSAPTPIQLMALTSRPPLQNLPSHSSSEPGFDALAGSEPMQDVELHNLPTPMLLSPLVPISVFPESAKETESGSHPTFRSQRMAMGIFIAQIWSLTVE